MTPFCVVNFKMLYGVHCKNLIIETEESGPEVIKLLMLNSGAHKVLNAHKYQNIKKFSIFQAQVSLGFFSSS